MSASADCAHETTRWNAANSRLVCAACSAEFKPGAACIRCGQPAVGSESFVCAAHTARATREQMRLMRAAFEPKPATEGMA